MDNLFFGGTTNLPREFTNCQRGAKLVNEGLPRKTAADILIAPLTRDVAAPPITMVVIEFPWPGCTDSEKAVPNCPSLAPGAPITAIHVPATWASKLLSEEFWRTPGFQKSDDFFHRPNLFVSETPNNDWRTRKVELRAVPPLQPAEDEMVMEEWNERHRIWNTFRRGWYNDAYRAVRNLSLAHFSCSQEDRCFPSRSGRRPDNTLLRKQVILRQKRHQIC